MCKAHVRGAKRRVGGGYGRGGEFFLEDILETAQFGSTLILIYRCKTGPGQHQETQSGLQEAMSILEKYSKSMVTTGDRDPLKNYQHDSLCLLSSIRYITQYNSKTIYTVSIPQLSKIKSKGWHSIIHI